MLRHFVRHTAIAFLLLAFSAPSLAGLMSFEFSYEFRSGLSLNGNLTGEIQPDRDTIFVTDYSAVYTGHRFLAVMVPDVPGGTASFSGNNIDLTGSGLFFGFLNSGGLFQLSDTGVSVITISFGMPDFTEGEGFAAERWNIESLGPIERVPAPGVFALFGLGLIAMAASRRLRRRSNCYPP